ncbi:hypothetical protein EST38_g1846 [Candolleomyces aberdarensis]|uniref:Uncharacterized protein n=1 Tax=Candolleomyces aberdarensis TaxID=2316362 RepID=A0A4Q2DU18_9AGAR|nr:hypothetical protein EST38_g1846 [Candolleomyces aberdarensis]
MTTHARTLPPELLEEIFVYCLPEDTDRLNPGNAPMALCQVSSCWRLVALAKHRLWDTVIFPSLRAGNSGITYSKAAKFIQTGGVERWFNRSGSRQLSFGEEGSSSPPSSLIALLVPIVTKYAQRFRHISLIITELEHCELIRGDFLFDNLESLSICCTPRLTNAQLQQLDTSFASCPKLKHVSLTLRKGDPSRFPVPWSQLISIRVDNPFNPLKLRRWTRLFQGCPNLQHATIAKPVDWSQYEGPVLEHEALTSLRLLISTIGRNDQSEILCRPVRFPNLRHLQFDFWNVLADASPLWNPETQRSLPNLQSIALTAPISEGSSLEIPVDVEDIVQQVLTNTETFPGLTHMTLPYHISQINDIAGLLRLRPPAGNFPGLTVSVNVKPPGRQETCNGILGKCPDLKERLYLLNPAP